MANKGTYNRRYYLHRRLRIAGFSLLLKETERTIIVKERQIQKAQTNKYIAELIETYSYGVQIINPMMK